MTFKESCKSNNFIPNINDYIDEWHKNYNTNLPLHEYLGMTWREYKYYVETPSKLKNIIESWEK